MKSALPKMLHPLLGRTLLGHVLAATAAAASEPPDRGGRPRRRPAAAPIWPRSPRTPSRCCRTSSAAPVTRPGSPWRRAGRDRAPWSSSTATSRCCAPGTLTSLVDAHEAAGAAATILTADVDDPYGLGRVIRNPVTGAVDAIVEERDATPDQRAVTEINAGVYAFEAALLAQALGKLTTNNDQGEEYLTDVIGAAGRLRTAPWSAHADRRPDRGARLQRPGRAGRAAGASCATGSTAPGCGTGSPSSTRPPPGST